VESAASQEVLELLDREPGISNDPRHGKCIYWIVPGNGKKPHAIGHDDVLALTHNAETSSFERSYRNQVIDTG
jgi:hypothetical protein